LEYRARCGGTVLAVLRGYVGLLSVRRCVLQRGKLAMIAFVLHASATGQRWLEEGRITGVVCGIFFRKRSDRYETAELDDRDLAILKHAKTSKVLAAAPDVEFSEGAMACGDAFSSAC
jgi:hypothetical protein